MNPPTAAELDAYRAQTDRLLKLVDFAARLGPAVGETAGGYEARETVDSLAEPDVLEARNAALVACLDAIADIARNS